MPRGPARRHRSRSHLLAPKPQAALDEYRAKRDFARTPEPGAEVGRRGDRGKRAGSSLVFVIQKHAATPAALRLPPRARRRADESWAVPKGPSFDPADKRMAVHVEDHPLSYGSFEGTIPPKQYGAGTVIVWDRGTWEPVGDPRAGHRARASSCSRCTARSWPGCGSWCASASPARSRTRGCCSRSATSGRGRWPSTTSSARCPTAWSRSRSAAAAREPRAAHRAAPTAERGPPTQLDGAVKAALPAQAVAAARHARRRGVPAGGDWLFEIKFDGYRLLARIDERQGRA